MVVAPSLGGGGAEKATLLIAQGLQELGIHTHLVLEKEVDTPLFPVPDVEQVHRLRSNSTIRSVLPLAKLIRRVRPDFVYTALPHLNILGAISAIASCRRTRLLASVHNNLTEEFRELDDAGPLRLLTPWAYRRAFRIIAVSNGVAGSVGGGTSVSARVRVVPNPLDESSFTFVPGEREERSRSRSRDAPRIVSIGRLVAQKNFALLINAFALFVHDFPAATLTIIGDGPMREPLERLIAELGLSSSVLLPGVHTMPSQVLGDYDLYVQTSDFEGFGLAILEAMASGLPCVSTDCDFGPRELIEHGTSGFLVQSDPTAIAHAMAEALLPVARSLQFGSRGYEISTSFTIQEVSRSIVRAATEPSHDVEVQR